MTVLINFKLFLILALFFIFSNNLNAQQDFYCGGGGTVAVNEVFTLHTDCHAGFGGVWQYDYAGSGTIGLNGFGCDQGGSQDGTDPTHSFASAGVYICAYHAFGMFPGCGTPCCQITVTVTVPVPIELLEFKGKVTELHNNLHWSTISEMNNDYFILERSFNGSDFLEIAKIDGAGNSNELINYSLIDECPVNGINYYRLKQVDYDACFTYSHTISLNFIDRDNNQLEIVNINPNPSSDYINIVLNKNIDSYQIEIYDLSGSLVLKLNIKESTSNININISKLGQGIYSLKLISSDKALTKKFVKTEKR